MKDLLYKDIVSEDLVSKDKDPKDNPTVFLMMLIHLSTFLQPGLDNHPFPNFALIASKLLLPIFDMIQMKNFFWLTDYSSYSYSPDDQAR